MRERHQGAKVGRPPVSARRSPRRRSAHRTRLYLLILVLLACTAGGSYILGRRGAEREAAAHLAPAQAQRPPPKAEKAILEGDEEPLQVPRPYAWEQALLAANRETDERRERVHEAQEEACRNYAGSDAPAEPEEEPDSTPGTAEDPCPWCKGSGRVEGQEGFRFTMRLYAVRRAVSDIRKMLGLILLTNQPIDPEKWLDEFKRRWEARALRAVAETADARLQLEAERKLAGKTMAQTYPCPGCGGSGKAVKIGVAPTSAEDVERLFTSLAHPNTRMEAAGRLLALRRESPRLVFALAMCITEMESPAEMCAAWILSRILSEDAK